MKKLLAIVPNDQKKINHTKSPEEIGNKERNASN